MEIIIPGVTLGLVNIDREESLFLPFVFRRIAYIP
jgi:hypothetical protein